MSINVRGLREGEIEALKVLVARGFAEKGTSAAVIGGIKADPVFKPELNRVIDVDGRLAGRLCIHDRAMNFGGDTLRVGAIGGVCVDPDFRRRGFCGMLLDDATAFMEKNGFDVSILFGAPAVYGGSGWQALVSHNISTSLPVPDLPGIMTRAGDLEADGAILQSLHQQFNAAMTGSFVRSPEYWNRWVRMIFNRDNSLRIWIISGVPGTLGYFINRAGTPGMVVEMAWDRRNEEALPGILSVIARQAPGARLEFPFYSPELRDAFLHGRGAISFESLNDGEYDLRAAARYSGLFKLISAKKKLLQGINATEGLLQLLLRRDYTFWWLDHF
ncbi:MAG: GNAT family N-acetyltransferase [Kiritimatiellia bacterium]